MNEILTKDRRSRPAAFAATLAVLFLLACAATAGVRAQSPADDSPRPSRERPARPGREAAAPALVRALNLSAEQRAEIARIRREVVPQTRGANLRARRARLALDEAIYAEADDETLIERRAAELAEAEGARARLRARTELRIRRLLTPEQLKAFRELRLRALARRERLRDARPARQRRLRRDAAQPSPPAGPADDDPEPDAAPPPRQSPQTRRPPASRPPRLGARP